MNKDHNKMKIEEDFEIEEKKETMNKNTQTGSINTE